jgi:GH43 family beta-xylosidase
MGELSMNIARMIARMILTLALLVALAGMPARACAQAIVRLESKAKPGLIVQHDKLEGRVGAVPASVYSAYFVQQPGLADSSLVSLESVDCPRSFLAERDGAIVLEKTDSAPAFKRRATFRRVAGLADAKSASLESLSKPGQYVLAQKDGKLVVAKPSISAERKRATFLVQDFPRVMHNPRDATVSKPDPHVWLDKDGFYYGMHTVQVKEDYLPMLKLYKSDKLSTLYDDKNGKIIWHAPKEGENSRNIWAPEIYHFKDAWYIYYSGNWKTRILTNTSADPTKGQWQDAGRLFVQGDDVRAIDGSFFRQNGKMYFIWSGMKGKGGQKIWIARMDGPTKLVGPRAMLSAPTYDWEIRGANFRVNEGPNVLQRNGKTFLVYSASFCGSPYYCLGMLTCSQKADPMDPKSWAKSPVPVFESSDENGLWAVGHHCFARSKDGKQDWLVYHAWPTASYTDRDVCMQQFGWNADGAPNFGTPVGKLLPIPVPSGE